MLADNDNDNEPLVPDTQSDSRQTTALPPGSLPVQCPGCSKYTGVKAGTRAGSELPEGITGVTMYQCFACWHEWEGVSHGQVLGTLSRWHSSSGAGRLNT